MSLNEIEFVVAPSDLKVITDYTYALDTLDKYDYQQLEVENTSRKTVDFHANYDNAMEAILTFRDKFNSGTLFGNEKDKSFKSSIGQIYQTFGGEELYPSVEEKAAMLLYLVTKNHSFSDGNKRIAAYLFLWFLDRNKILYREDGTKCQIPNFYLKGSGAEILPIYVTSEGGIVPKREGDSLEGFDVETLYCLGCSWSGSLEQMIMKR